LGESGEQSPASSASREMLLAPMPGGREFPGCTSARYSAADALVLIELSWNFFKQTPWRKLFPEKKTPSRVKCFITEMNFGFKQDVGAAFNSADVQAGLRLHRTHG
jgi:hypothetical protein